MSIAPAPSASNAVSQLKALAAERDPYAFGGEEIDALQLEAIQHLFEQRLGQISVLARRASDLGVTGIRGAEDLLGLLFAHQTYKSYPDSFVAQNRWALMNRWLDTLSATTVGEIDLSGVTNTDSWVARLSSHGHHVLLSSGTSGKTSFLNRNAWDRQLTRDIVLSSMRLTQGIDEHARDRPVFLLGPRNGTHIFVDVMRAIADGFGRPEATYWLSELALTEADTQRQAELRRKLADGTATPSEIRELEHGARERQEHMRVAARRLAAALLEHRHEPVMLVGLWLPHFLLMEEAHKLAMSDGQLHPGSTIFVGGGLKGAQLPDDFREQLARFHGLAAERYHRTYGMVELAAPFLWCEASRYHRPPWLKLLILDREGENLLARDAQGRVKGRMAFFDVATEARWGGVISGDEVEVRYGPCPCGRPSPAITSIVRYADLQGGDDKLSCAGTMSSYVRGAIEA